MESVPGDSSVLFYNARDRVDEFEPHRYKLASRSGLSTENWGLTGVTLLSNQTLVFG